jgi:hypothetical protein
MLLYTFNPGDKAEGCRDRHSHEGLVLCALEAGTVPLHEEARRLVMAAVIHGELMAEGMVVIDALIMRLGISPRVSE